jgi:heme oxygenase (biliverdin-IX-beta and delta-forming)
MITERLKAETAAHHKATEAVSYGEKIMSGSLTKEEYATLIEKNYILHALVEKALVDSGKIPENMSLSDRLKTQSLIADLTLLNHPIPALPSISISYDTTAKALGAMYVVEGATLGGAYIFKALQRNPNIAPIGSFNYYSVYGDAIGPNWKTFQEGLIQAVNTPELEDEAIKSAKQTFELFTTIFTQRTA